MKHCVLETRAGVARWRTWQSSREILFDLPKKYNDKWDRSAGGRLAGLQVPIGTPMSAVLQVPSRQSPANRESRWRIESGRQQNQSIGIYAYPCLSLQARLSFAVFLYWSCSLQSIPPAQSACLRLRPKRPRSATRRLTLQAHARRCLLIC